MNSDWLQLCKLFPEAKHSAHFEPSSHWCCPGLQGSGEAVGALLITPCNLKMMQHSLLWVMSCESNAMRPVKSAST